MTDNEDERGARPQPNEARRRRAALRSLGIASAAAFAGGAAVFGLQYALGLVSAGYPPVVHALFCSAEAEQAGTEIALAGEGSAMAPIAEFVAGTAIRCRIDAPVADYATWSVIGPVSAMRSGPLDPTLPCQSSEDFANQDPAQLRLSTCLRMRAERPGLYLLSATVMQRGQHSVDRARMVIRVVPAPDAAAPSTAPRNQRLAATLRLPAMAVEQTHEADLSASFGEHGLLPQSRAFERIVYRLAPGEEFVSAAFQARSAANASAVELAHVAQARVVRARFTLRSGPVVDRWRGWVSGTVAVRVRRQEPPREIDLPEADLAVPGRVRLALPEGVDAARARILLRRPETSGLVELAPGGTASLDAARVTARIEDGALLLQAEPE